MSLLIIVLRHFLQSRSAATEKLMEELGPGSVFISPSNDTYTIAGQGTIAVEFLEQVSLLQAYDMLVMHHGAHCAA